MAELAQPMAKYLTWLWVAAASVTVLQEKSWLTHQLCRPFISRYPLISPSSDEGFQVKAIIVSK